jgi:SAM-dependent methyltransferase
MPHETAATPPDRSTEPIYRRPADYDLEHEGDEDDIRFYVRMIERLRPRRVLELACGSGRVTLPLAEAGARLGAAIVGLELADEMIGEVERKRRDAPRPYSTRSRSCRPTCACGGATSRSI